MIAQRIRSLGISWTCSAMNWSTETFVSDDGSAIRATRRFGFWLETQFGRAFGWFYDGSDQEIDDALEGIIPRRCMSERQRQAGADAARSYGAPQWSSFFDEFFCADCDVDLTAEDVATLCAHCRALHPEMLLEDRK